MIYQMLIFFNIWIQIRIMFHLPSMLMGMCLEGLWASLMRKLFNRLLYQERITFPQFILIQAWVFILFKLYQDSISKMLNLGPHLELVTVHLHYLVRNSKYNWQTDHSLMEVCVLDKVVAWHPTILLINSRRICPRPNECPILSKQVVVMQVVRSLMSIIARICVRLQAFRSQHWLTLLKCNFLPMLLTKHQLLEELIVVLVFLENRIRVPVASAKSVSSNQKSADLIQL